METEKSLTFITLNTGHVEQCHRQDLQDQEFAFGVHMLGQALKGQQPRLFPWLDEPMYLEADSEGFALTGQIVQESGQARRCVLTLGVQAQEPDETGLWQRLHNRGRTGVLPVCTDSQDPPEAPWLAARLEPGAVLNGPLLPWMADFERLLAWSWVAMADLPVESIAA